MLRGGSMIFGGKLALPLLMNRLHSGTRILPPMFQQAFSSSRATMIGHPDLVESNKENYPPGFVGLKPKSLQTKQNKSHQTQRVLGPLGNRENLPSSSHHHQTQPALPSSWECDLKNAKLLIVEGNIGVGKTTLSKKLAEKMDYRIFLEPTTENPYLGMSLVVTAFILML